MGSSASQIPENIESHRFGNSLVYSKYPENITRNVNHRPVDRHRIDTNNDSDNAFWFCDYCYGPNQLELRSCAYCQRSRPVTNQVITQQRKSIGRPMSVTIDHRLRMDASHAEKQYRDVIDACQKAGVHFVDDEFIPTPSRLDQSSHRHVTQWLPISVIIPLSQSDLSVPWSICNRPEPKDIRQGILGDCWLMAALALVTERPAMLRHILLTDRINQEGVYAVRLCHNGLWKTVILDDCFPCNNNRQMVYSQAARRQLYVPLIEKACAKLNGSYASLSGGSTSEGLLVLTGAPCERFPLDPSSSTLDFDLLWTKIISACESRLLIGASTGRRDLSSKEYRRLGLNPSHAFSILLLRSFDDLDDRFLFIRDPHGVTEFSDSSISFLARERLHENRKEASSGGTFWISWPTFLKLFNSVTISTFMTNQFDVRQVAQFTQSATDLIPSYYFTLTKPSLITITLVHHRETRKDRSSHNQSLIICDVDEASGTVGVKEFIFKSHRETLTYWSGMLSTGTYVVIPFSMSFWHINQDRMPARTRNYTLIIHSSVKLHLVAVNEPAFLLSDCLLAAAIRYCNKPEMNNQYAFYSTSTKHGVRLFVVENRSTSTYLNFQMEIAYSKNIRYSRRSLNTRDCIPPRHRQLVGILEWIQSSGEIMFTSYTAVPISSHGWTESVPTIDFAQKNLHFPRAF